MRRGAPPVGQNGTILGHPDERVPSTDSTKVSQPTEFRSFYGESAQKTFSSSPPLPARMSTNFLDFFCAKVEKDLRFFPNYKLTSKHEYHVDAKIKRVEAGARVERGETEAKWGSG